MKTVKKNRELPGISFQLPVIMNKGLNSKLL